MCSTEFKFRKKKNKQNKYAICLVLSEGGQEKGGRE